MNIISEGKARFYASVADDGKISKELDVFYNPIMKFNRDVSVLLMNSIGRQNIQIADILAGSGVRSLRLLLELDSGIIKNITVNDYSPDFPELFKKNLELNDIATTGEIIIKNADANKLLLESSGFDYIDVDPFGSPNDFLELSIVRLSRDGILAVTATDTAPLSGTYPDACQRKYWARPMRNYLMHEVGLRILIRKVQLLGANHDKALVPIYSYFKDHYNRIFFKCIKSKKEVDNVLEQHKYFLYCNKCMISRTSEFNNEHCIKCSNPMEYSGPMWIGDLCDTTLTEKILNLNKDESNTNFLNTISEESKIKFIGFHDIHVLCKNFKLTIPNFDSLIEQIKQKGYFVSRTHFDALGIKTNIPIDELKMIIEKL